MSYYCSLERKSEEKYINELLAHMHTPQHIHIDEVSHIESFETLDLNEFLDRTVSTAPEAPGDEGELQPKLIIMDVIHWSTSTYCSICSYY